MALRPPVLCCVVLVAGMVVSVAESAPLRVLYFSKSSGFEHSVVKRVNGQPSYSEKILAGLGATHGIEFTFSKDGSKFSIDYLAQFDAVLFYTSGDLSSIGTDGQPAMTAGGKQALLDWVSAGGALVGVHSTADTFHTGETGGGNPTEHGRRYYNYGAAADPFIRCLGGELLDHGEQQVATARVTSPGFPGFENLGNGLRVKEEWYSLKEFAPDLHVLLVLETDGMEGRDYQRPNFPVAWARAHGRGRVAYNAMGHREDVWDSAAFQTMLIGALKWAAGAVEANLAPNLATVAPGQAILPPAPGGGTRIINISARAWAGTGDNVAIGGFVIAGNGSRRILLRAVGPTLAGAGLGAGEVMRDPTITLYEAGRNNAVVSAVDNWGENANATEVTQVSAELGAGALAATDTTSSAAIVTLPAGIYTFVARGKEGTSGIVAIEAYDAEAATAGARIMNISARAHCTTGNGVTIGGFVVAGSVPKRVLLRAVGPTLGSGGVAQTEVLQDPVITVHDARRNNAVIATNDNWAEDGNSAELVVTGARVGAGPFAATDRTSSALLLTLMPGVYSFVASGKDGDSGIVLIELYDAD